MIGDADNKEERSKICVEACRGIYIQALKGGVVSEMLELLGDLRRDGDQLTLKEGVDFKEYCERVSKVAFSVFPPGTFPGFGY